MDADSLEACPTFQLRKSFLGTLIASSGNLLVTTFKKTGAPPRNTVMTLSYGHVKFTDDDVVAYPEEHVPILICKCMMTTRDARKVPKM